MRLLILQLFHGFSAPQSVRRSRVFHFYDYNFDFRFLSIPIALAFLLTMHTTLSHKTFYASFPNYFDFYRFQ